MKQTLKTSIVGAALMMSAVTAQNAAAGNLVIDVDGIAGGTQLNLSGLGSSLGNFLAESALLGSGANINEGATTVYAQYGIRINQPGCLACELTVLYSIPMTTAVVGNELSLAQTSPGSFKMWFDTTGENISDANTQVAQISGNGYGDGVLLLEGSIQVVPPLTFTRGTQPVVDLDPVSSGYPSNFDTIQGTGSTILEIDLTFQAPGFVLSNVTGGTLDLQVTNTLRLNYTNNVFNRASMAFADVNGATPNTGTIVPNFGSGANPLNDFDCNNLADTCDFIAQSNITFLFFETPEPGTLALLGGGLVLFGGLGARRQKKVAA